MPRPTITKRPAITKLCGFSLHSSLEPNPFPESCFPPSQTREAAMRSARTILASATAVAILTSAALAQQAMTGMVTQIDRLNGTMAIVETQSGTVGASSGGATQQFKVQDAQLL